MATIKDVARVAGVGLGTASRVISGKGSVAPATVEKVKRAIAQLDFRPSHTARSLLSGSSQMIGVYIPMLKGSFYAPLLRIIDMELRGNGQHMVMAFGTGAGNERLQAKEGIEFLLARGCDGLVVMSNLLQDDDLVHLGAQASTLVLLNHHLDGIAEQCFSVDHQAGGRLAAQALLDMGHKDFAIISGPDTAPDNRVRVQSFMDRLAESSVDPLSVLTVAGDFSPESGWAATRKLLAGKRNFTALFCANDEMAVGALSYFHEAGISVPEEISVMGYDDIESAEYTAPQLTTVRMPWREATLNSLYWLLGRCYGKSNPVAREFPVSISWRRSVADAKK